ncbi:FAD-dependent monooxygenase [Leucobacter allii]|uniref:FAD-dependent monooxygenase n=1 Tax=Leucobacter allii TaxID=2932247 RepID=A0ABY4FMD8_9MICO|nr:FAD-dependent monooxygenase [Leucobacter allii]UOQ57433.1 FAD-dependent monooxygenase [Leucobacter allii]
MSAVSRVAIAGAGIAGTAAAIHLAEQGVEVDVFERKDSLSALGSGITLQGNLLRVLRELGVWQQVERAGYSFDETALRAPGPGAEVLATIPDARTGGPDLPATTGMHRPALAEILLARAEEVGARVRFGAPVTGFSQNAERVTVAYGDGGRGDYDLLIGADGLHSAIRRELGIDVGPEPMGMGAWRASVPRPAEITRTDLYYGGPAYLAGYCPTAPDAIYAYFVEAARDTRGFGPAECAAEMARLARAYGGPWDEIRRSLPEATQINYTQFTHHVVPGPWHRGRVVLIGEAAHSCPPTIAQGAAQAGEDALVLAELLLDRARLEDVWEEFHARRLPRATAVVEASVQLGRWLIDGDRDADVPGLMRRVAELVSVPA